MIATVRLYVSARGRVVLEGDPAAASLLVGVGGTVPVEYLAEVEALLAEPSVPVAKAEKPVADKAIKPAANKAVKPNKTKRK